MTDSLPVVMSGDGEVVRRRGLALLMGQRAFLGSSQR